MPPGRPRKSQRKTTARVPTGRLYASSMSAKEEEKKVCRLESEVILHPNRERNNGSNGLTLLSYEDFSNRVHYPITSLRLGTVKGLVRFSQEGLGRRAMRRENRDSQRQADERQRLEEVSHI
jgi:hypothetical protein